MNGKGSKRRTEDDADAYREGWSRIFGKKEEKVCSALLEAATKEIDSNIADKLHTMSKEDIEVQFNLKRWR